MHVKKEVLCFVNYVLVKIFGVFSRFFSICQNRQWF